MSEYQILEMKCNGCERDFTVMLERRSELLCPSCVSFNATMAELHKPRDWEKPQPSSGFWRGVKFAAMVVAPIWFLFYFLVIR